MVKKIVSIVQSKVTQTDLVFSNIADVLQIKVCLRERDKEKLQVQISRRKVVPNAQLRMCRWVCRKQNIVTSLYRRVQPFSIQSSVAVTEKRCFSLEADFPDVPAPLDQRLRLYPDDSRLPEPD